MSHIRQQIREAVIERLRASGEFGLVDEELRAGRDLQRDEFPLALVGVTDKTVSLGKGPAGTRRQTRQVTVVVRVGHQLDDLSTIHARLDDLTVVAEELLADPSQLGVGALLDWGYVETGVPDHAAYEAGYGVLPIVFSGTLTTLEGRPQANLHS